MDTGTTEIGDETTSTIDTCDGSGCSEITVEYPGHIDQIKNLILVSETCSQEISFKCFSSALKINSVHIGWWINAKGNLFQKIYLGEKVLNSMIIAILTFSSNVKKIKILKLLAPVFQTFHCLWRTIKQNLKNVKNFHLQN